MRYLLFEDELRLAFLPLSFTRPVWDLRVGIFTVREKWTNLLGVEPDRLVQGVLGDKFGKIEDADAYLAINGRYCPDSELIRSIKRTDSG